MVIFCGIENASGSSELNDSKKQQFTGIKLIFFIDGEDRKSEKMKLEKIATLVYAAFERFAEYNRWAKFKSGRIPTFCLIQ